MAFALIILAIGSVFAGYVGVPQALWGSNRIERFLEPSFEAHAVVTGEMGGVGTAAVVNPTPAPPPNAGEAGTHGEGTESPATEYILMAISVGAAVAGIFIASYFWLRNRRAADNLARSLSGPYDLLLHKYYVDELYDAAIVHPIQQLSTHGLWRGADAGLIDGAVNGVGRVVRGLSSAGRRAQTGSVRAYAASLFIGVVLLLGWYLIR